MYLEACGCHVIVNELDELACGDDLRHQGAHLNHILLQQQTQQNKSIVAVNTLSAEATIAIYSATAPRCAGFKAIGSAHWPLDWEAHGGGCYNDTLQSQHRQSRHFTTFMKLRQRQQRTPLPNPAISYNSTLNSSS